MELQMACFCTSTGEGGYVLGHADWLASLSILLPLSYTQTDYGIGKTSISIILPNGASLTVLSVEYRLAPEDPFPAGSEDCYDVAEYLVDNRLSQESGPLKFVGGESAGALLSALTVLHPLETRPAFSLVGVCMNFGLFDLSLLPSARTWTNPLIQETKGIEYFLDAYLPNLSADERRNPSISPMYHPIFQYISRLCACE